MVDKIIETLIKFLLTSIYLSPTKLPIIPLMVSPTLDATSKTLYSKLYNTAEINISSLLLTFKRPKNTKRI